MELILKSNNEQSIGKIIALAKKLNVTIEKKAVDIDSDTKDAIKNRILNFRAAAPSTFGDALEWQRTQREDRKLPFD